jgi:AbrB family looped-hinge helix DNA binding protein
MALAKIQSRGQVTIPAAVRRAAGVAPGDVLVVDAAGKGQLHLTAIPTGEPLAQVFKRYGGAGAVTPGLWDRVAEAVAADTLGAARVRTVRKRRPARGR